MAGETRLDIQALRAVAVLLVVVFHFFPDWLPGGYVGVDAFFVVSGYLITLHLAKELERTGTILLGEFWARRARRLLPASLLVLCAVVVGVALFVPLSLWRQFTREIGAATFYALNWRLAADSVAYSAAENDASPVQHFWSLSVEEQFYLAWPLLLLGAVKVSRRREASWRGLTRMLLASLLLVSLGYSIWMTEYSARLAYFDTFARAWEFGAGAALALAGLARPRGLRSTLLAWCGLVLLALTAVFYGPKTPFPGFLAALPVLGTLLVLAFGATEGRASVARVLGVPPVTWLGDHSYGIYLWHWPLLVIPRLAVGRSLTVAESLLAIGGTLLLAMLSKRYIEDPVRYARALVQRPAKRTFALVAAGMGAIAAVTYGAWYHYDTTTRFRSPIAERAKREVVPCFGADAEVASPGACERVPFEDEVIPDPAAAKRDSVKTCMTDNESADLKVCEFGDVDGAFVVGLVGDSHAAHWLPALQLLAIEHEIRILTFLKGSCPLSEAERASDSLLRETCEEWKEAVEEELDERKEIDALFVSASSRNGFVTQPGEDPEQVAVRGYVEAWEELPENIEKVVVLRDIPRPRGDVTLCLERLEDDEQLDDACALPRDESLLEDPAAVAATRTPRAVLLDFSDVFCDDENCRPVVGNALVYRDGHHMTATFARTMAPLVERELDRKWPGFERP